MRVRKTLLSMACFTIIPILVSTAGQAQSASMAAAASPELVGQLTKQLSITPAQATGGAGTLFNMAKSRLPAGEFGKVAAAVPGMGSFLKAAQSTDGSTASSALSSLSSSLPGEMGSLASTAGAFDKLGLSPAMAGKFVPILTQFVQAKGGSGVASLLSGALK
jgi:hypothetical protein